MENYLNSLDMLYESSGDLEESCCNNHENHSISHEKISCFLLILFFFINFIFYKKLIY